MFGLDIWSVLENTGSSNTLIVYAGMICSFLMDAVTLGGIKLGPEVHYTKRLSRILPI